MENIAKIFGFFVILILINIGISNSEIISFRLWPFDFEFIMNSGLCFIIMFLLAFFAGGLFMWMGNFSKHRKANRTAKKQIKNLERKLKESEK